MNIIKQVQIELSKLMKVIIIGGSVLFAMATRIASVLWTHLVLRIKAMRLTLMASPLVYVSDIQAKPIYLRKAVKRLCVFKMNYLMNYL